MASPGDHNAAKAKHLRVLLPFSSDSLRIPEELDREIGALDALFVGPCARVWPVKVGRDGDGAFLGRGWPEFAAACGVGAGWLVVLRHRGRGVLTVKAFDATSCLRELGTPAPPAGEATMSSKNASRRPQFISVLAQDSMEKMLIPAEFVRHYLPKEHLNNHMAVVLGPFGKVWSIELEMNQSDVFFADRWSKFLEFYGITEANALLLRYEGYMVFTVKVFEPDGCQRESKHNDIILQQTLPDFEEQQMAPFASIHKRKSTKDLPSSEEQKKPKGSMTSLNKASLWTKSVYEIGPPSWIRKLVNANTLKNHLALPMSFCDAIGLHKPSTITLKTTMDSTESWLVHGRPYKKSGYRFGMGWRRFCQENSVKIGDICTFNVVKITLWHADITRCKEKINQKQLGTPSPCNSKYKGKKDWPNGKAIKRSKVSTTSLNKGSSRKGCVFEIGPPSWIKKEVNTNALENYLSLPLSFCDAIGFRKPCTITLQSSIDSTKFWLVHGVPYNNGSHKLLKGWKRFCEENRLKEGDVCTFNIIEPMLWHVDISRYFQNQQEAPSYTRKSKTKNGRESCKVDHLTCAFC